jgi:hypothetical protein
MDSRPKHVIGYTATLKQMPSHPMCIIWWRRIAAKARILIHQELDNILLTQLNNAAWTPQVVDGVKMST